MPEPAALGRRRHRRVRSPLTTICSSAASLNRAGPSCLTGRWQEGDAERIWKALDHLPFDHALHLILREIDGLRYEEIAFSLGIAVGTVKSRLTRARQALRAELLGPRT